MIRSTLLLLTLILMIGEGLAQKSAVDSLVARLAEMPSDTNKITTSFRLARALRYSPQAKPVLNGAYSLANQLGDTKFRSFAANNLGILYYYQGNYDSAVYYFHETADIAEIRDDKKARSAALNNISSIHFSQGDHARAMDLQLTSLKLKQELQDSLGIGTSSGSIAGILMKQKAYNDAHQWMEKGIAMFEAVANNNKLAIAYANMAQVKAKMEDNASAIAYNQKALALLEGSGDERQLAANYIHMAAVYKEMGQPDKALLMAHQAVELNEKNDFDANLGHALQVLGGIQLGSGALSSAIVSCEKAKVIAEGNGEKAKLKAACNCLFKGYKLLGDHKRALVNLEVAAELADTLMNEEQLRRSTQSEMQYSFDTERELERSREEKEDALAQLQIDKQTQQKWIGVGGMVALALIAFLLFRSVNQKKKDNSIIAKTLSEKELLLKEIHHRVKNNLQIVSSLLSLQSRDIKDDAALEAVNESRNRVKSMALIHQNLYKEDDLTGIDMKDYIALLSKSLLHNYKVDSGQIELITDIDSLNLDVDTTIPVGLILNELMTNVLKYAFPNGRDGKIHVTLKEKNSVLLLQVRDNGVGYDPDADMGEESSGFGTRMIETFSKKLKADYSISNDAGTLVELKIHNYKKAS